MPNEDAGARLDKEIWEGWTGRDFVDELLPQVIMVMRGQSIYPRFKDYAELEDWVQEHAPGIPGRIPACVVDALADAVYLPIPDRAEIGGVTVAESSHEDISDTIRFIPPTVEEWREDAVRSEVLTAASSVHADKPAGESDEEAHDQSAHVPDWSGKIRAAIEGGLPADSRFIRYRIVEGSYGLDGTLKYNVQCLTSHDGGESWAYAGVGRYCKDDADVEAYLLAELPSDVVVLKPDTRVAYDGDERWEEEIGKPEVITCAIFAQNAKPRLIQIENTLEGIVDAIGGPCELVEFPFRIHSTVDPDLSIDIVVDEEGKINGQKPNRAIFFDEEEGLHFPKAGDHLSDIAYGTVLVVAVDNTTGECVNLPVEDYGLVEQLLPIGLVPVAEEFDVANGKMSEVWDLAFIPVEKGELAAIPPTPMPSVIDHMAASKANALAQQLSQGTSRKKG